MNKDFALKISTHTTSDESWEQSVIEPISYRGSQLAGLSPGIWQDTGPAQERVKECVSTNLC